MADATRTPAVSAVIWVIAWGSTWALVVMERILELHERPLRTGLIVGVGLLIVASAPFAARRIRHGRARYLPLLLLSSIAIREGRRYLLRLQYMAGAPVREVRPPESLFRPLTTTQLAVRYYALSAPQISTARLRLVLLTDLHVTRALPRAYYEHVFELVSAQDADLILLAGDYTSKPQNIELVAQLFARPWPARIGAFAVLGNHDYWTDPARIRDTLAASGVTLVGSGCRHLPLRVGRVAICGTEAPWGPELSANLDRAELNLVLSHTPDNVFRLAEQGAALVFSGHTHGGQVRLPGLGALVVPSRFGRLFSQGHFKVEGADLFVSAGLGADAPPVRVYCPPEILVVDLTGK